MLRSFIASIGGGSSIQTSTPLLRQHRSFSAVTTRRNEARERTQRAEKEEHPLNYINADVTPTPAKHSEVEATTPFTPSFEAQPDVDLAAGAELEQESERPERAAAHIPWYLQVESPVPAQENAISARQQIPELPEHPPALLEPLLQHVSVELGMDDLTLMDLRPLDPPPALGANLFMLVGTARSERHLHVSADKLCRWLRTYHDLTPVADGLLGRQELKVKMRRRAKRARLMSAVGAKSTADTELEEGIRTGWVCVNLGRVEGGELPKTEAELEAEKKIVGFGQRTTGSHLVVQLLTEDKRGELDLEKLWTGMLQRSRRAKEALLQKEEEEEEEEEVAARSASDQTHSLASEPTSTAGSSMRYTPTLDTSSHQQQQTVAV